MKFGQGEFDANDRLITFVVLYEEEFEEMDSPFSKEDINENTFLNADFYDGETIGVYQSKDRFDIHGTYRDAINWLKEEH